MAMGYHLHAETQKTPEPASTRSRVGYWLRSSTLWPWSISRMIVLLQSLQKTSRLLACVSGSTRINR